MSFARLYCICWRDKKIYLGDWERLYYHYDNSGLTTLLTDAKGKVTERFDYGIYGELLSEVKNKIRFLFNGSYVVKCSGLAITTILWARDHLHKYFGIAHTLMESSIMPLTRQGTGRPTAMTSLAT